MCPLSMSIRGRWVGLMDHRQPGRLGRVTLDFREYELVHEIVFRNFDVQLVGPR